MLKAFDPYHHHQQPKNKDNRRFEIFDQNPDFWYQVWAVSGPNMQIHSLWMRNANNQNTTMDQLFWQLSNVFQPPCNLYCLSQNFQTERLYFDSGTLSCYECRDDDFQAILRSHQPVCVRSRSAIYLTTCLPIWSGVTQAGAPAPDICTNHPTHLRRKFKIGNWPATRWRQPAKETLSIIGWDS